MSHISIDDLIECIEKSTKEIKIKVPSQDYYARPGDAETQTLSYISPYLLKEQLNLLRTDD